MAFEPPPPPLRIRHYRALVIDDMPEMRASLRQQLGMLDVTDVDTVGDADAALRLLALHRYDLVLCDWHLGEESNGQQLLEHLRETDALPEDAIFFMCTGENAYTRVLAAAEVHPDDYLLKPFTSQAIESRIRRHLARVQALREAREAHAAGRLDEALACLDRVVAQRGRFALDAQRLKARWQLAADDAPGALATCQAVLEAHPELTWAEMTRARCLHATGRADEAMTAARELRERREHLPEPWELMATLHAERGETDQALALLRRAAEAVPTSRRLRAVAETAWRAGDLPGATEAWERLQRLVRTSLAARPRDLLRLAQALVDLERADEALAVLERMPRRFKADDTLAGTALAVSAQARIAAGQEDAAAADYARATELLDAVLPPETGIALGRAALACGYARDGLRLLGEAIQADHEAADVERMARDALARAGKDAEADALLAKARAGVLGTLDEARRLMRQRRAEEAMGLLAGALERMPANGTVRLAAAQLTLMWISQAGLTPERLAAANEHLARLDALLPDDERVRRMRRFLQETLRREADGS